MKQFTDVEELVGQTVTKVSYDACDLFIQTEEGYIAMEVDDGALEIKQSMGDWELFYHGIITREEYDRRCQLERERIESESKSIKLQQYETLKKELGL